VGGLKFLTGAKALKNKPSPVLGALIRQKVIKIGLPVKTITQENLGLIIKK
jgi:hypothetical protein